MDEFCRRDSIEPALFGIKRSTPVALMTDNQVDFLLDQVTRHGIPDDGDRRRLYDELILKANAGTIMEESGFLHHPV